MLIDARTLPAGERIAADVCIVGGGPVGILMALELSAAGLETCIIEAGGERRSDGMSGTSVGYPYYPLATASVHALGGSSLHWGNGDGDYWHAGPFDEIDFEVRDGIPHSGWPFARAALVPFYRRAEAICQVESFDYSPCRPADDVSSRPLGPGPVMRSHLQISRATFSNRDRLAADDRVRVLLNAQVTELRREAPSTEIVGVHAETATGRDLDVRASAYVLAAGGIENARLLLIGGIGNQHDLVGRFFMEHIAFRSGAIVPSDARLLERRDLHAHSADGRSRPILRLDDDAVRRDRLLSVAFLTEPRPTAFTAAGVRSFSALHHALHLEPRPSQLVRHMGRVVMDAAPVVRTIKGHYRPGRNDLLILRVQAEQAPNPTSRVTLGHGQDAHGLPLPQLDWRFVDLDRQSIRATQDILDRCLRESGLGRLEDRLGEEDPPALILGQYHHLGTTRMHDDPRHGVVDANSRVHGSPNLYAAGGSVFPTVSWANPTFTVIALALRLADHLVGTIKRA